MTPHTSLFDTPPYLLRVHSVIGRLLLESDGTALTRLRVGTGNELPHDELREKPCAVLVSAAQQLAEYFEGTRQQFVLKIALDGTPFQHAVWNALELIPHGRSTTYGELARAAGVDRAARAAAGAVAANPLPIILPCHRVLGQNGSSTGYSVGNGLELKEWLLTHESIPFRPIVAEATPIRATPPRR